ncbi:AAA family ATPase [Hoyosella rhizosphaerae]|nr:AAA family ATPase [Hoyosella rhizosphaerae]
MFDGPPDLPGYPFELPVVRTLATTGSLTFAPGVTFFVGDNGSGKSTLVESLAVAAGFNAEGGSKSFQFSTRSSDYALADRIRLRWNPGKPRSNFFLRAESLFNVATEIERLGILDFYGSHSLHEQSHGESFLHLANQRFRPNGFYILDEPEAALSVQGCLALVARIAHLVQQNCQFIIATHSPILLALPHARILEIDGHGAISKVEYDSAEPVQLMRRFLDRPDLYLHHLLSDD